MATRGFAILRGGVTDSAAAAAAQIAFCASPRT
jgi:hypothetical protein